MGRKVEETMLRQAYEYAKNSGLREIEAEYKPTKKNKPCFDFWIRSLFNYDNNTNRFTWSMDKEYPSHDLASIEIAE
jgi:predicted enzyme involved in methoxymalonyl-ACP biosynthesis